MSCIDDHTQKDYQVHQPSCDCAERGEERICSTCLDALIDDRFRLERNNNHNHTY